MAISNHFGSEAARHYAARPPRQVPGYEGLLAMVSQLLGERVPEAGHVLVLGAGGGLEIRAMAEKHAAWMFEGADPSAEMLALAREITAPVAERVVLTQGVITDAAEGPYDGATCLLTFHFIARDQRLETLRQIHRRPKPGAPFALAHISFAQTEPERSDWISRHVAYQAPADARADQLQKSRDAIGTRLTILAPEEEEAMLVEAGFSGVNLFYAALSFRGWIAYA